MAQEKDPLYDDLEDKDGIIGEQDRKIHELYQKVDNLNAKLSELYASDGWRLLSVYYRIRNRLLPSKSPHYQKIKHLVNRLRGKKTDDLPMEDHSNMASGNGTWSLPTDFELFEFPYFSHPKVSIVIPAHNGWGMNYQCLRSIRENTQGVSYEVIFADDVSTDETQFIDRYVDNIVHIR